MTKSMDDLLNDGAPGLQYFEQLGPRYAAAFGGSFDFYALVRPYDNERGMSVAKLEAASTALRQLLTTADSKITAQQSAAQTMQAGWQGAAAEAAAGQLGQIASMASEDRDAVRNFEAALSTAAAQIPALVTAKADTVSKLMEGSVDKYVGAKTKAVPTVGGLDPVGIDSVIDGSKTGSGILDHELAAMTSHRTAEGVADIPDTSAEIKNKTSPEYKDAIKEICKRWLSIVFMPDYNDKVRIFQDQCTTTRLAIENLFTSVETAAAGVVERSYPSVHGSGTAPAATEQQPQGDQKQPVQDGKTQPQGTQQQAQGGDTQSQGDQSGGSNQPSTGNPTTTAGTQTGDTTGTKTATQNTDDSTDDTDTSTALSTLTSTISELGTSLSSALTGDLGDTITSAVESVGTSIGDGIEQLSEQASSLMSSEHSASFQIGDTKVSVEAGENGLSLTTTDADGGTNKYSLTLDENGNPVLTQESTTADAGGPSTEQGDGSSAGVPGSGTPQSGAAEGSDDTAADGGNDVDQPDTGAPAPNAPVTSGNGVDDQAPAPVVNGGPAAPRPANQESDGEHTPGIENHPVNDPGDSGAVLAEAGPL